MTPRRLLPRRPVAAAVLPALFGLHACIADLDMAGGSSEVDNPQVLVAFVDTAGDPVQATGSLGAYLSDQSPALDPDPLLEIRLNGADVAVLSARHFDPTGAADSARSYNLYFRGEDSTGAFLQGLTYDPAAGRFLDSVNASVTALNLTVSQLVRTESVLQGGTDTAGLNRLIVPGSPFQTVLVDSVFVFEEIPAGVFPVHIITPDGVECPLPEPMDTKDPGQHTVNLDTTPVVRPPPPPVELRMLAGEDKSVFAGTEFFLVGDVSGVSADDNKLAIRWRQLPPTHPDTRAFIERPAALRTRVRFPRPGAYTFALEGAFGTHYAQDTVVIGVLAPPDNPVFIEPSVGDTVSAGIPVEIIWEGKRPETLSLQFSLDGGASWQPMGGGFPASFPSVKGINKRTWTWVPQSQSQNEYPNGLLRLRNAYTGYELAVSQAFLLRRP